MNFLKNYQIKNTLCLWGFSSTDLSCTVSDINSFRLKLPYQQLALHCSNSHRHQITSSGVTMHLLAYTRIRGVIFSILYSQADNSKVLTAPNPTHGVSQSWNTQKKYDIYIFKTTGNFCKNYYICMNIITCMESRH